MSGRKEGSLRGNNTPCLQILYKYRPCLGAGGRYDEAPPHGMLCMLFVLLSRSPRLRVNTKCSSQVLRNDAGMDKEGMGMGVSMPECCD